MIRSLKRLFQPSAQNVAARQLYIATVNQARSVAFYEQWSVPDTVTGRFDMISLHAYIVMRRLMNGPSAKAFSEAYCGMIFTDMDRSLREMGVGDVGVSKRIKVMAEAFYGRASAYANGMREQDNSILINALKRNLYRSSEASDQQILEVSFYMRDQVDYLKSQELCNLSQGEVLFIPAKLAEKV